MQPGFESGTMIIYSLQLSFMIRLYIKYLITMNKHISKFFFIASMAAFVILGYTACQKDNTTSSDATTLDAQVNQTLTTLEQRGNLGAQGCYDLVFPVSIKLADGTVITAPSQDSLRHALKIYHQGHPGMDRPHQLPTFVYPVSVIAEDGSVIVVANETDLRALKEACHKNHLDSLCHRDSLDHKGFPRHDTLCFTLVFPINVLKADGTTVIINSAADLKALSETEHSQGHGHQGHHGPKDQLNLVFPITVKKSDGSTQQINTKEELKTLREQC